LSITAADELPVISLLPRNDRWSCSAVIGNLHRMSVPFLACMALVASTYQLPPRVLPSIQAVEGGRVGLARSNTNGSQDLGVMQINTLWIRPLARHAGLPEDEVRERLLHDACFNIAAAGLILRIYMQEAQGDLMRAIGYYHSHTPDRHFGYRAKVTDAAQRLFAPRPLPAARP
jgi:soluble lytic murein transglycosylase-like protein